MLRHCTLLFIRFLWCAYLTLALFGCAAPNTDVKGVGLLPSYDGFVFGTVPEKERIAIKTQTHAELSSMVVQACGVARAERADQQYIGQDRPTRTVMTTRFSSSYETRVRKLLGLAPIPEPEPTQSPAEETPLRPIEHPAVQGGAGLVSGTAIGFVPGGPIGADLAIRAELLPEGTRPARIGKACGELIAGVTQIVVGCGGMGTGIGMSGTGGGAIVGVPVFVGSLGLTINGVSTCAVGAQHLLVEIWHPKDDPPVAPSPETSAPPAAKPPQQPPPAAKPPQQPPPAAKPPQQTPLAQTTTTTRPSAPPTSATGTSGGPRAGKPFTRKGKAEIDQANAARNNGANVCENCSTNVVPAQKSEKGVRPPGNERQRDHKIPRSKGGDGDPSNGEILCRDCNLEKGNKL